MWLGLHNTNIGGPCLSFRRAEIPTSCQCWRESRYLLEKDTPAVIDGGSGGPRGKGTGSRAHRGLGTQPWRSVPLPRPCMTDCQLVPAIVGVSAAHPVFGAAPVTELIRNNPNLVVQEEQEQGSSLAEVFPRRLPSTAPL